MHKGTRLMLPLLLVSLLAHKSALGAEYRIDSADKFITFSNNVNSGQTFSGTTVFLDADIDFSGKSFTPVAKTSYDFQGTFDGQGHKISNLKISTAMKHVALFGYSSGSTIKNTVLDDTCSIESSYSIVDPIVGVYIAGFIGDCVSTSSNCLIENCVNMGIIHYVGILEVSFDETFQGGIVGKYDSDDSHQACIRSCVNYGLISDEGKYQIVHIGGIVGHIGYKS